MPSCILTELLYRPTVLQEKIRSLIDELNRTSRRGGSATNSLESVRGMGVRGCDTTGGRVGRLTRWWGCSVALGGVSLARTGGV